METKLLKPSKESISLACSLLKQGEIVGIPTETVYGLAGDCTNPDAIKKIFKAKGRPADNPLIVHISNMQMLDNIVSFVSEDAKKLAGAFWPGPLTIIMPKGKLVCNETCAGLDSVGVRMPANEVARQIIEQSQTPFSAPSANISGKPSPTNACDVFEDMNDKIPLIIDGGECEAGVESTVVSVLNSSPIILRPGIITKEMMERVLNKHVLVASEVTSGVTDDKKVLSPGMKYKHYSPNAEVIILKGNLENFKKYVDLNKKENTFVLCFNNEENLFSIPALSYGDKDDASSQAHNLFSKLRQLDKQNATLVFARCPETTGVGLAVYNRLIRSAGFKIINIDEQSTQN